MDKIPKEELETRMHSTTKGKDRYTSFFIGDKFQVMPPGDTHRLATKIPLIMERGAFGSGEHETTRNCIEILEQLPLCTTPKVLDFGSGTGILSIAALKLGADEAWCLDIDEKALVSCQENCRLNHVSHRVHHFTGYLEQFNESEFDLLLANIYGDILLNAANDLVARLNKGAWLILSGILWEDNYTIRRKYQTLGCKLIKNHLLNEYSSILLQKM